MQMRRRTVEEGGLGVCGSVCLRAGVQCNMGGALKLFESCRQWCVYVYLT